MTGPPAYLNIALERTAGSHPLAAGIIRTDQTSRSTTADHYASQDWGLSRFNRASG